VGPKLEDEWGEGNRWTSVAGEARMKGTFPSLGG